MAIYTVIATDLPDVITERALVAFGDDWLRLTNDTGLIASNLTAIQVSNRLGVGEPSQNEVTHNATAIVASMGNYWGRSTPTIWDWIARKWVATGG